MLVGPLPPRMGRESLNEACPTSPPAVNRPGRRQCRGIKSIYASRPGFQGGAECGPNGRNKPEEDTREEPSRRPLTSSYSGYRTGARSASPRRHLDVAIGDRRCPSPPRPPVPGPGPCFILRLGPSPPLYGTCASLRLRGCEKIGRACGVRSRTSDHPGCGWRAKLRAMFWAMANHVATDLTFSRPRTMNCPRPRLRAWALTHSAVAALSL